MQTIHNRQKILANICGGLQILPRPCNIASFYWSFQDDSIHLDLRSLKKIEFLPPYNKVRFGSGLTWNQVLNVVDPEKYTVIHGNVSFPISTLNWPPLA